MELIFLWLVFSLITIMVAAAKGKNILLWLVLGIIFGPLALIYLGTFSEK